jgi:predicted O-methyltransferase YrrM
MDTNINAEQILLKHASLVINQTEGGTGKDEMDFFLKFLRRETQIKTILEIGFNAGLSAKTFLYARPDITVISVDIGEHEYVLPAKKWIDKEFPNRHMLFIGDSTKALPQIMMQFPLYKPDMIFVDGGHEEPYPRIDISNAIKISKPDTFIVIDDVVPWMKDILSSICEALKNNHLKFIEQGSSDIWGWAVFKPVFE